MKQLLFLLPILLLICNMLSSQNSITENKNPSTILKIHIISPEITLEKQIKKESEKTGKK